MQSRQTRICLITTLIALTMPAAQGQSLFYRVSSALADGATAISMRYRFEEVTQDNALRDATASTLRTRLTWTSAETAGFKALLEIDNVTTIGPDHYDAFVMDKYRGRYSIIADPVGTEVNQALLRYQADAANGFVLGMQRIQHARLRFVGNVGWRQNEQTFDAFTWQHRDDNLDVDYSYLWNVNRIFGGAKTSVQQTNLRSDSHIALATYKTGFGDFGFSAYALDFANAAGLSSLTWGVSYARQFDAVSVNASFARQSDYGDNPLSYNADYLSADVGYNFGAANIILGYELLGSDDGISAFATPLATLHIWQGWTDLFLITPAAGIQDRYLTLSGKLGEATLLTTYHDFASDEGSSGYGTEWDLRAVYPLTSSLSAEITYATYDRDGFAVDTDKFWISLNLRF